MYILLFANIQILKDKYRVNNDIRKSGTGLASHFQINMQAYKIELVKRCKERQK